MEKQNKSETRTRTRLIYGYIQPWSAAVMQPRPDPLIARIKTPWYIRLALMLWRLLTGPRCRFQVKADISNFDLPVVSVKEHHHASSHR